MSITIIGDGRSVADVDFLFDAIEAIGNRRPEAVFSIMGVRDDDGVDSLGPSFTFTDDAEAVSRANDRRASEGKQPIQLCLFVGPDYLSLWEGLFNESHKRPHAGQNGGPVE